MQKMFLASLLSMCSSIFAQDCQDLLTCSETVSKLSGKKYIFPKNLNRKFKATSNFKLNENNADLVFPTLLGLGELARIPVSLDTYKIIEAKNLRYEKLPVVKVNLETKMLPMDLNPDDYYTFEYYFKHANSSQPMFAVEGIRLMLTKHGRVFTIGKSLLVHDKAVKFPMALKVAQGADRDVPEKDIKRLTDHLIQSAKYYEKKSK